MNKKVSIALCTYNGQDYLIEQLESLLSQTYPIFEIVVQDDGSTDGTMEILNEYTQKYPNLFRVYQNAKTLFWNQNFYSTILKCKGDYIALCDQDDVWDSTKIEKQVAAMADGTLIHVCSSFKWYGDNLTPRYSIPTNLPNICVWYCYCGHQMLLDASIKQYIHIGQEADMAHDKFLSILGIYLGILNTSKECLVKWRRHSKTATGQLASMKIQGKLKVAICLKALLKGEKSKVIECGCEKYYYVLSEMMCIANTPPHTNSWLLRKWYRALSKQTVLSYIYASCLMFRLGDQLDIHHDIRYSRTSRRFLYRLYNNYTWVFRWWFDHRMDM